MSKFQRKLTKKMSEKTMTISVKDWDKLKLRCNQTEIALKGSYKTIDRLLEDNSECAKLNYDLQQKLQTIKEIIKVMIHNSIYSGIKNKHKKYHIDDYHINKLKEFAK